MLKRNALGYRLAVCTCPMGRVAVSNMTNPSVVVELGSAQLTRIMERANPEAPEKAPPTLLMEMNKSVKNVDLGKAGGAVEPPKNSPAPTGTQAPAKQGSKAAPKPVEDGKLVVDPSGESTLDAPAGQTSSGAALPQGGKSPGAAPSGGSDGASGDDSGADGGGLDGATAPKIADPAANVEKAVQQINTSATRPIDAKGATQNRKTKIGVNVR